MRNFIDVTQGFSGSLLIAHPGLGDPRFTKSVILLSAHSSENGALGVIINRPLGKTLSQFDGNFVYSALADVPIYTGGPVSSQQMIFTAWHWGDDHSIFKLHFGITHLKAQELLDNEPGIEVRCFLGYAGWGEGQLESELKQNSWVVSPINLKLLSNTEGEDFWKRSISSVTPELRFLVDIPEDPSMN